MAQTTAGFRLAPPAAWKQWALRLLVGMAVTHSELRLEWIFKDLRHRPDLRPVQKAVRAGLAVE